MQISDVLKKSLLHTCGFCGGKNKECGVIYQDFRVHWICTDCVAARKAIAVEDEEAREVQNLKGNPAW